MYLLEGLCAMEEDEALKMKPSCFRTAFFLNNHSEYIIGAFEFVEPSIIVVVLCKAESFSGIRHGL